MRDGKIVVQSFAAEISQNTDLEVTVLREARLKDLGFTRGRPYTVLFVTSLNDVAEFSRIEHSSQFKSCSLSVHRRSAAWGSIA